MKRTIFTLIIGAFAMVIFSGCGHQHVWEAATCTKPQTCKECGATTGQPNGHTWEEATCDKPKTCSVCGSTEGEALGHTTELGYCDRCGELAMSERVNDCFVALNSVQETNPDLIQGSTADAMYGGCMQVFNNIKTAQGQYQDILDQYGDIEELSDVMKAVKDVLAVHPPKPSASVDGINNFLDGASDYENKKAALLKVMAKKFDQFLK